MLAGEIHPGQVDADDLVPYRFRQGAHLAVTLAGKDSRVGADDVELAIPGNDLLERGLDARFVADIDGDGDRIATVPCDVFDGLPGAFGVAVEDGHLAAFLAEALGGGLSDAGARPG